uniref:NADH-ubiquinone oxidoreductase chain 3 n=1 Tax=Auriculastra duplicata TaxID=1628032 RepID=A0A343SWH0_9EUPU|nr:NADH dehydrogenase subunit 3 [Auriculastra duplicata]AUT77320.1 NADH dehydrogenase subunit 3 [Auriculastra duplicata]
MLSLLLYFSLGLGGILLVVYYVTSFVKHSDHEEKMTPFECGFEPLSQMRSPFSTRFFILVVLFLIFDVEVALLFPILSLVVSFSSPVAGWAFVVFLMILLFGLFHEWAEGAIDWVSS